MNVSQIDQGATRCPETPELFFQWRHFPTGWSKYNWTHGENVVCCADRPAQDRTMASLRCLSSKWSALRLTIPGLGIVIFENPDRVDPSSPTALAMHESIAKKSLEETGWDRLSEMFQKESVSLIKLSSFLFFLCFLVWSSYLSHWPVKAGRL